jgi:hypothetical protein
VGAGPARRDSAFGVLGRGATGAARRRPCNRTLSAEPAVALARTASHRGGRPAARSRRTRDPARVRPGLALPFPALWRDREIWRRRPQSHRPDLVSRGTWGPAVGPSISPRQFLQIPVNSRGTGNFFAAGAGIREKLQRDLPFSRKSAPPIVSFIGNLRTRTGNLSAPREFPVALRRPHRRRDVRRGPLHLIHSHPHRRPSGLPATRIQCDFVFI